MNTEPPPDSPEIQIDEVVQGVWQRGSFAGSVGSGFAWNISEEQYAILLCLVKNGGRVVSKRELAAAAWPESPAEIHEDDVLPIMRFFIKWSPKTFIPVAGDGYTIPFTYKALTENGPRLREEYRWEMKRATASRFGYRRHYAAEEKRGVTKPLADRIADSTNRISDSIDTNIVVRGAFYLVAGVVMLLVVLILILGLIIFIGGTG